MEGSLDISPLTACVNLQTLSCYCDDIDRSLLTAQTRSKIMKCIKFIKYRGVYY